jgi:hypothetical protein
MSHAPEVFCQAWAAIQSAGDGLSDKVAGLGNVRADQAIIGDIARLAGEDNACLSQHGKVLRRIGLLETKDLAKLPHGFLSFPQLMNYHQALGIGETPAKVGLQFEDLHLIVIPHGPILISILEYYD